MNQYTIRAIELAIEQNDRFNHSPMNHETFYAEKFETGISCQINKLLAQGAAAIFN